MKRKLSIFTSITCCMVFAYGAWIWWKSPSFALLQIAHAIHTKDQVKFHKYVDLDRVAGKAVEAIVSKESTSQFFDFSQFNLIERFELRQAFKAEIDTYFDVSKPSYRGQKNYHAFSKIIVDSLEAIELLQALAYFEKTARTAHIGLNFSNQALGIDFRADLKLEKNKNWQLVEITNAEEIFSTITYAMQEKIQLANQPILEILNDWVYVSDHQTSSNGKLWQLSRTFQYSGKFHNFGKQDIRSFSAVVNFYTEDDEFIDSLAIAGKDLTQGASRTYQETKSINLLFAKDRRLFRLPSRNLRYQILFQELVLADGQRIKPIEAYDEFMAH
ncbi:MAG: hypothetical protein ACOH5I_00045 [Oligoflexus sp.]